MKFQPRLDFVGMAFSFAAILILLFFGLTSGSFAPDYWVAFAFWFIGFFGMVFMVQRSKSFNIHNLFIIAVGTAAILVAFFGLSWGVNQIPGDLLPASKLVNFAIGVSEELFFGVFCLTALINWMAAHPLVAIGATSIGHALYHIPTWGADPVQLAYFFTAFFIARTVYVYMAPYVGVLVGAHGIWNFIVS